MSTFERLVLLALSVLLGLTIYIAIRVSPSRGESWEVIVPRSTIGGRALPPNFSVKLVNVGMDTYRVLFAANSGKDRTIHTIFLHRPEDEPMLRYLIKGPSGAAPDTLPAGTVADLWFSETNGLCWSSTMPVSLPGEGQGVMVEMTVALCL